MKIGVIISAKKNQCVSGSKPKELAGKPLAYWIADSLMTSKHYEDMEIWISTDSQEVVDLYKDGGYSFRYHVFPDPMHEHDVSINTALSDWMREHGVNYDLYVQTRITNPFMSPELIDHAVEAETYYTQTSHRSVMGVTRHDGRMWYGSEPINFKLGETSPAEALQSVYEENSCIYSFDRTCYNEQGRVSPRPYFLMIPWPKNFVINSGKDLALAELIEKYFL